VRRADAADASLLAELGARIFYETFVQDTPPEDMDAYLKATYGPDIQRAELNDPQSTFFIAETGGAASGYALLRAGRPPECVEGARPIELARLYVSQGWHGHGVGEALMRACVDEARRAGFETLWLGVWEHNARAKAFYAKWEFVAVGSHIFAVGTDEQIDLLMSRAL
jgi:GNAT superfamily N-acetyltransferase